MTEAAETYERYRGPEFRRLMAAARRSLERSGGEIEGSIGLTNPTTAERDAVIGITGTYRSVDVRRITISLSVLEKSVRTVTGMSLRDVLERIGPELRFRACERTTLEQTRHKILAESERSPLHTGHPWYRQWLAVLASDGTITALINKKDTHVLRQAVRVLEFLHSRPSGSPPVMLPSLADTTTGDTKALNHGRGSLPTLVLRALAMARGIPLATGAESRRELWDAFDVIVDDLASRVLVLNLPATGRGLGQWLTDAARYGTPFQITLHQLITLPIAVNLPTVYVCENPAVLRRAAGELGASSPPLICAEGRPSTAFHRLARLIVDNGGLLRYHGDFDWPGIAMTNALRIRYGAEPWRMNSADYLNGVRTDTEHVPLSGQSQDTPWDPTLAETMAKERLAVYEEAVADTLLKDWTPSANRTTEEFG
ncbi:TIGR02679 family protein [Streptomyces scopuliridis]|uniref:TIGR02679 family protein n=1 Tax=Streptomyces scopuliridis TaxID=452529 RepID=A0ACD4ZV07_9ACTN|nr:TIGR02679 family protein [Streptomyces scopuliridis]WSC01749.1 TIGR02679 family protein [Streptomyces scopuliridis]WSC04712.1 TIGR02679 family protein [Streptomyces scopuliridis]